MGDHVTYVDFILFEILDFGKWVTDGKLYEEHQTLEEYFNRVKSLPRLAEYYADDRLCMKGPYNNKIAKLNNNEEVKKSLLA